MTAGAASAAVAAAPGRPPGRPRPALRAWLRSVGFTLALSLLVAAGVAEGGQLSPAVMLGAAGVGLGVLYLLFPHGMRFAFGTANGFAVYACLYVFMGRAGFPDAAPWAKSVGFLLPIVAFLAAVWLRRGALRGLAEAAEAPPDVAHLPRVMRVLVALAGIGVVSMVAPEGRLSGPAQTLSLLAAMAAVGAVVAVSVRDVVRLLVNVALIFETVGPVFATPDGPIHLDFADALHFSVATLSTVGYGDIRPLGDGVRVLASLEVLLGQLLLLFGFAEIMRGTRLRARDREEAGGRAGGPAGGASRGNHSAAGASGGDTTGLLPGGRGVAGDGA